MKFLPAIPVILVLVMILPCGVGADCIQGDCENGQGVFKTDDGGTYTGRFMNKKPQGRGQYDTAGGASYNGEFSEGEFVNGLAKFTTSKGDRFEGEFSKGNMNGKGTLVVKTGEIYSGEFKDGDFNGQGTYTYTDGTYCKGEFKDGKLNGPGVFQTQEGTLEGEFRDNEPVEGTFKGKDGAVYVGHFKNGKFDGHGIITLPDGRKMEGEFKDGTLEIDLYFVPIYQPARGVYDIGTRAAQVVVVHRRHGLHGNGRVGIGQDRPPSASSECEAEPSMLPHMPE